MSLGKWIGGAAALVTACYVAGWAAGQDGKGSIEERLKQVRREVKVIDLPTSIPRIPALIAREKEYSQLLDEIASTALNQPERIPKMYERARNLKLAALKDLNEILRLHRGPHTGINEKQIWERLKTRFLGVSYEDEWLVNILDDIEEAAKINIELDARIYKFDSVTFDFEASSARAMLQMMGDELEFQFVARGDTLYVYKERNEVLFGRKYDKARKKAKEQRAKDLKSTGKGAGGGDR